MAEQEITKLDELEYKWVDGYKHRSILADIGWNYCIRDGYTTDDQEVITLTNTLEDCLRYKNTGIPNLMDYLLGEIDGTTQLAGIAGTEQFNLIYKGIQRFFEDIDINHLGDVYTYKKMIDDVESGNFGYIIGHVEVRLANVNAFKDRLGEGLDGYRYYYEGRGFDFLGDILPGMDGYELEGFETDSRGFLYTKDLNIIYEMYRVMKAKHYLWGDTTDLRNDLPKSLVNTKYENLLYPGNEEALEVILDNWIAFVKEEETTMSLDEIKAFYIAYTEGTAGDYMEAVLEDYFRATSESHTE